MNNVFREIEVVLSNTLQAKTEIQNMRGTEGGCINQTYSLRTNRGDFFVKINNALKYPGMFESEARALNILRETNTLRIPEVIAIGQDDTNAFLLMEYIDSGRPAENFWTIFALGLTRLHRCTAAFFGLDHGNYIGSLPQDNTEFADWIPFFIERRLEPQLKAAVDSGYADRGGAKRLRSFFGRLDQIFPKEAPALLHGDLWNGNYMTDEKGEAVLIDPALYYGHREMDLAMTLLFGGFPASFYEEYHHLFPLENGWRERMDICNLYPLLVHVNLFGGGYWQQISRIIQRF